MNKLIVVTLIVLLSLGSAVKVLAEEIILNNISPEEKEGQFMINLVTNKPAEFISYTLSEPPRVILEPIRDIFTQLDENALDEAGLVNRVKIIKDDKNKISSIIIELKKDIPYHLVKDTNLVSVYLTLLPEEKPEEKNLTKASGESEKQPEDQISEEEMKRIRELNKLIAPTKLPPAPSVTKPYISPRPTPKPPTYTRPNLSTNVIQER